MDQDYILFKPATAVSPQAGPGAAPPAPLTPGRLQEDTLAVLQMFADARCFSEVR